MRIAEAASACGLTPHTIRFYEKSDMLPKIERGPDGHRRFTPQHIEWLTLLYWMRETGMPLKQMRRFAKLAKRGHEGLEERRAILLAHAESLREKRAALDKCERILAVKIASYGEMSPEGKSS